MTDTTQTMTFEEAVRKRPFMYIGNDGVVGLFQGLIIDCIKLCKTDEITFEITISGNNDFTLGLTSPHNLNSFIQKFTDESDPFPNYFPKVLKVVSEAFDITAKENSKTEIAFSFDKKVIADTQIDYLILAEKTMQIAMLNRQCEIITTDKRQKYLIQNYYHFPEGIFYLFDRATKEALGRPEFKLTFDDEISTNKYQIGLAYRTDWYPTPNVISFANDVPTIYGGSLVEGILDGLLSACKTYVKEKNLTTFKIRRKKFLNGLIIVCAVRGEEYKYGGSFKETLEDDTVKKLAKKITAKLALDFFNHQKERAATFLRRFDTTQLTSGMY